ncbi:hypothetical protein [Sinorhizobium meliloti]|uniref:hypothetical protein n=1 Tax=Rhizobium meliloti TaxID=382 RepID=UPI0013E33A2B|nr:hypothetical protein [Sinorhizobium meliloti]
MTKQETLSASVRKIPRIWEVGTLVKSGDVEKIRVDFLASHQEYLDKSWFRHIYAPTINRAH